MRRVSGKEVGGGRGVSHHWEPSSLKLPKPSCPTPTPTPGTLGSTRQCSGGCLSPTPTLLQGGGLGPGPSSAMEALGGRAKASLLGPQFPRRTRSQGPGHLLQSPWNSLQVVPT